MTEIHILVVDDEEGISLLCERLLIRAGYQVTAFTRSTDALKFVEHNKFDMLLVDIRMPEISGFDLIAKIKLSQPDVAVLVMTGYGTVDTAIQALHQGVDGLLLKPFKTGNELVMAVEQALDDNQKKRDIARIQALRPLFDIIETFLAETRPERLITLITNAVCGHLHCENAGYFQYFEEDSSLRLTAWQGEKLQDAGLSLADYLINQKDIMQVPQWVNTNGPGDANMQIKFAFMGLGSVFIAPISRSNIRGVLFAGRNSESKPFRDVDWEMFLLLARQATVALENAWLYDELRNYVKRVEDSQQALVRAEKMAAAGRLTASIAHEINNPLQAVKNCLHLATRKEIPKEKQREYIAMANIEMDRLMVTVQRMLDFYRPGNVSQQRVNVTTILRRVVKLLSSQLQGRNIRVTTGFSSKLPAIMAVSSQLEQVFINIILNAYDAMPDGGELRISARLVQDVVEILFRDSGPGISVENQSRIFEPFVSTKESGTGLGLSVSYGIISAHGGNIDLVPNTNPGACFRITLPVQGEA